MPTSRDVLWERALSALPHVLLSALRAAELDDPRVLIEYPTGTTEDFETLLGETFGEGGAPSGAASTEQPPSTSGNSCSAAPLNSSGNIFVCWWSGGGRRPENGPRNLCGG